MKTISVQPVRVFCILVYAAVLILLPPAGALAVATTPDPALAAEPELTSSYLAPDEPLMSIANPAVAYCDNLGYECVAVDEPDGQRVVCLLPDGRRVDAWDFFRGKVAPEYSYCAREGLGMRTKVTDHGAYTTECAVCVSERGVELGTVAELSGFSFDTIRGVLPPADEDGASERESRNVHRRLAVPFGASPPSGVVPAKLDWRTLNGTTAVKSQLNCGSCWAFSTAGAMECNILIKDGIEVDLSEQYLVSCNDEGWSCSGGGFAHGYHMLKQDFCGGAGAVLEDDFPYQATNAPCDCPYPHAYQLDGWGFIPREGDFPTNEAIKRAIMENGPISVGVLANSSFTAYRRGIYIGSTAYDINHAVVLVGWDDNQGPEGVWFLRNSWGTMWGEMGYMRIAYGSNAVGFHANWVEYRDPIHIVVADAPTGAVMPDTPVTVTVRIDQHADSYVTGTGAVHWRARSGSYKVVPLEPIGDGFFEATIPAASCGDTLDYYYAASGQRFGCVYNPTHPRTEPYTCPVGFTNVVFHDDFETDKGWTVQDGDELAGGSWERGVPAGSGDRSDPTADYDGSGSCYLTENVDGNSDVDKDYTRLTSPVIDLSGGEEAVVSFAYWYRNDRGDNPNCDYFVTSLSNDGGATWVHADTVGPRAPLPVGWYERAVVVGEHVALTDQVRVRVQVADEPGGSLVEAGLDDFSVEYLTCSTAGDEDAAASAVSLRPNAPNPFGRSTVIRYELPTAAPVHLTVHNASGRTVRTLVHGEHRGRGPHAVRWDGRNDGGRDVAAGVYFYRLVAGGETLTAKMIFLK